VYDPIYHSTSLPGTITIVPPSGAIVGSDFFRSSEEWIITGNKLPVEIPTYEKLSRGPLLNYYIKHSDNLINNIPTDLSPSTFDQSLWYFEAPSSKYSGNYGISYGGNLSFSFVMLSGDIMKLNSEETTNIILLECDDCDERNEGTAVSIGIRLGFSIAALRRRSPIPFLPAGGKPVTITIPLSETAGWLKDPQNVLSPWIRPSQCDIIQVLSRLSKIRILGDWTTSYESVAIDNVLLSNIKGKSGLLRFLSISLFLFSVIPLICTFV
jgi:hypothetical protein